MDAEDVSAGRRLFRSFGTNSVLGEGTSSLGATSLTSVGHIPFQSLQRGSLFQKGSQWPPAAAGNRTFVLRTVLHRALTWSRHAS